MVQIQLSVIFLLAVAAIAPIVALPMPTNTLPPIPGPSKKRKLYDTPSQPEDNPKRPKV
jgi:hypothetical protein